MIAPNSPSPPRVLSARDIEILGQIEQIAQHDLLHGSEALCKILRFLGQCALREPGVPAKEYVIATEVLGRSERFDPRLDATVRVQVGRLRSKLAQYYAGSGLEDQVRIWIPKGAYMLMIDRYETLQEVVEFVPPAKAAKKRSESFAWTIFAVCTVCTLLLGVCIGFLMARVR